MGTNGPKNKKMKMLASDKKKDGIVQAKVKLHQNLCEKNQVRARKCTGWLRTMMHYPIVLEK